MQIKDVMTIDEVAELLKMPPDRVLNHFNSGRLRGWREPGTGERRVASHHLLAFVREMGLPPIEGTDQ